MRRIVALLAAAIVAFCAGVAPALAAIGTPTAVANQQSGAAVSGAYLVTFNGNCNAGNWVIVVATVAAFSGTFTIDATDSAGNSYATDKSTTLNSRRQLVAHAPVTTNIVSGTTTINVTPSASGRVSFAAICVSGLSALDVTTAGVANAAATSSSTSITTSAANTLIVGWIFKNDDALLTSESTADSFTSIVNVVNTSNNLVNVGYKIVSSASTYTFAPAWAASATSESALVSYAGSGGGGSSAKSGMLLKGAGP